MANFCLNRIKARAGIPPFSNNEKVHRVLKKARIKQRHAQNKRILRKKKDLKIELKFAQKVNKKLPKNSWIEGMLFYIDGTSFTYKANSFNQARAPKAMISRIPDLGHVLLRIVMK